MGTVSAEQARDFYRAAANFYRQTPWRIVGEGETIEIRCQQLSGGPWYAVILGKMINIKVFFFFQAEDGIRDADVTGVQTCALPIWTPRGMVSQPLR